MKYAGPLADAVLAGIAKRFTGFFDRSDLIMASITLPQFKLCWLDDSGKEQAPSLLCSYARFGLVWFGFLTAHQHKKGY